MASSSSSSSSYSPGSSTLSWKYDVFLSFRGEDTRKNFVDHLYSALVDRLIRTYKDDEALPRGDSIGPSLLKSIEESHIAVIVFSRNYADSSWCLDELAYIMKCRDERGLIVMPIFYDVDPSDVRKQKKEFGKAFAKQEAKNTTKAKSWRKAFGKQEAKNTTKVKSWRKALVDASNIAGWEPKNIASGHESKVIKQIVDKIQDRLFFSSSDFDEELVGMKSRSQDLISHLEIGAGGVHMVGIWGIGGSGKTTVAFSVYKEVSRHFQGNCIVANIREESNNHGIKILQQKVLSTVFKTEVEVQSVEEGKCIMNSRLRNSKVLLLLDDVDDLDQLQALAGSHKWFGSGSRIIITTRDEHVLRSHRVDHISPVRLLSDQEAFQLFYKHAYNERDPISDYKTLSLRVVSYAAGLPLALKVLGSFLFDKDENEWKSALSKLKDIPDLKVMDILKISYDGLEAYQKELFLDIACFFRRQSTNLKDEAMEILDACGFHPVIGIKVLRQKALINTVGGKFDMHDLVQEMGHYIVRGGHPNNPEKHTRVWKDEEIRNMSFGDITTENHKIEAIKYDGLLSPLFISNMKKLRWLVMYSDNFAEGPNFLSNELRYFDWMGYPASPLPESFQPMNLVVLKLDNGLPKELWKGYKNLPHLKVLELSFMKNLLSTPNFDGLPCLQKLKLSGCDELEEIHSSLGNHRSLECISVSYCDKLIVFPTIAQMKKLNTLEIRVCQNIIQWPEIQAVMESLENLSLCKYWMGYQPQSIRELETVINLRNLDLSSLRTLELRGWGMKDGEIPSDIGKLSNLEELDLSRNDFSRLGFSLSQLTRLKILILSKCKWLVELPELSSSVTIFEAEECNSLTSIGNCHKSSKWLCQVSLVKGGNITDASRLLESMLQGRGIEYQCMIIQLEGLEIPKKFLPRLVSGDTCTLQLPENWCNDFFGFIMCAVMGYSFDSVNITMKQVINGGIGNDSRNDVAWEDNDNDTRTWLGYVPFSSLRHTSWWDETYSVASFLFGSQCSRFGVGIVPKKSGVASTETSTYSSEFSHYTPHFDIIHDSASALEISLGVFEI